MDAMTKQLDAAALALAASGRARGRSAVVLVHNYTIYEQNIKPDSCMSMQNLSCRDEGRNATRSRVAARAAAPLDCL